MKKILYLLILFSSGMCTSGNLKITVQQIMKYVGQRYNGFEIKAEAPFGRFTAYVEDRNRNNAGALPSLFDKALVRTIQYQFKQNGEVHPVNAEIQYPAEREWSFSHIDWKDDRSCNSMPPGCKEETSLTGLLEAGEIDSIVTGLNRMFSRTRQEDRDKWPAGDVTKNVR